MKKRIWTILIALFMTVLLVGCGDYTPPSKGPSSGNNSGGSYIDGEGNNGSGNNSGGNNSGGNNGGTTTPGGEDDSLFTVTLMLEGAVYTNTAGLKARWQNRYGIYEADLVNGVATMEGLDGEYHVTLSALPTGDDFTYDSSGIYASNKKKHIEVELLKVLQPTFDRYTNMYRFTKLGTYRVSADKQPANLESSKPTYYYRPIEPGWYSITSWVNTAENKINPKIAYYNGSPDSGFFIYAGTADKGGSEGTYTKNFMLEYKVYDDEVTGSPDYGNAQGFLIFAETTDKNYPVDIEFTIKYEGEYRNPYIGDPVYADETLFYTGPKPSGSFQYLYKDDPNSARNGYILKASKVKLNPDDKYYHLYDEKEYASSGGWGPLLFVMLTKDNELFFTFNFQMPPQKVNLGFAHNHLNDGNISCNINGDDYAYMITTNKDEFGVTHRGYADYCNIDGAHPVTEELKTFLQGYAISQRFFDDGTGWAEEPVVTVPGEQPSKSVKLDSDEDSQWLFACGYYK